MRIAVGGFHIEASTYNPGRSREADFSIVRGAELLAAPAFRFLCEIDAEIAPTFHARAVPGAPMAAETYAGFKAEFLERLGSALPVSGLYLALHGAANVEGMDDPEGDFVAAARALVGPDIPIAVSLDLHGNVSQRLIEAIDIFTAYRTAPHVDTEETQKRAMTMLVRALRTGVRPTVCWAPIPVLLPGERTVTTAEPGRGLYERLGAIEARLAAIWDAALMVGFVWADEPRAGAAAVMTGTDPAVMEDAARDLARAYWKSREAFTFSVPTGPMDACIEEALQSQTGPVFLSDSGDNVTAGGPGDRADALSALVKAKATDTIVAGIIDAPVTLAAHTAGTGATLSTEIGATLDPAGSTALAIRAKVDALFVDPETGAREAVLKIEGIKVAVTEQRKAFTRLSDFTRLGLDPAGARVVVVKLGYLFPELAPLANPAIMMLSHGIVDQDVVRLPRSRTGRPTYPFETDFEFTPRVQWGRRH